MTNERKILKRYFSGDSARLIAAKLCISRNTVSKVLKAFEVNPIPLEQLELMSDTEIHQLLFPNSQDLKIKLEVPDFEYMHIEMQKNGVNLTLLWEEYCDDCNASNLVPYKYSQFCKLYKDFVDEHKYTMNIHKKPGEKIMVDWMGTQMPLYDSKGQKSKCYIFVATLPYSLYTFAKACESMNEENWIRAHVEMYEFFGGVSKILVPDNLKTGVISHRKREDPIINPAYQEMADYYKTAILPTRVRAPKDKAAVEGAVGNLTTHIVAKLRNSHFTSIELMNEAIREALNAWNAKSFQKREGSRLSVFNNEEVNFLAPLPKYPYDYATWKKCTVNYNYHIQVNSNYYSVPYQYTKKQVDVRVGASTIEIYFDGNRISSHKRLYSTKAQYSTKEEHMPPNHIAYNNWGGKRFREWAKTVGDSTFTVIDKIIKSYPIEEQAFVSCMNILKLTERYGNEKLESSCCEALKRYDSPVYTNIKSILASESESESRKESNNGKNRPKAKGLLRGPDYYGGKK